MNNVNSETARGAAPRIHSVPGKAIKAPRRLVFFRLAYQNDSVRGIACLVLTAILVNAAETPAAIFERAVRALNAGDYATAESGFQQVLKSSPEHLGVLQNLGLVYSRTNRLDEAIATYRRALAVNPLHRGALLNLGL